MYGSWNFALKYESDTSFKPAGFESILLVYGLSTRYVNDVRENLFILPGLGNKIIAVCQDLRFCQCSVTIVYLT